MSESRTFVVHLRCVVHITVHDPDAITRCFTDAWRGDFYDFDTEGEVLDHLAINVGVRQRDVSALDGWADLGADAVRAQVISWEGED